MKERSRGSVTTQQSERHPGSFGRRLELHPFSPVNRPDFAATWNPLEESFWPLPASRIIIIAPAARLLQRTRDALVQFRDSVVQAVPDHRTGLSFERDIDRVDGGKSLFGITLCHTKMYG